MPQQPGGQRVPGLVGDVVTAEVKVGEPAAEAGVEPGVGQSAAAVGVEDGKLDDHRRPVLVEAQRVDPAPVDRAGAVLARQKPDAEQLLPIALDDALHIGLGISKTRRDLSHAAVRVVELQVRHRPSRAASVADTQQQGLSNLFPDTPQLGPGHLRDNTHLRCILDASAVSGGARPVRYGVAVLDREMHTKGCSAP
ncbi:hypothetical protein ACFWMJ_29665 [Streptomyces hawaiiensis]|uniref:hypothetical protein n=1 Tax=Streptomyces hawaiiensis TaxID=67305 RepID=UPI003654874A